MDTPKKPNTEQNCKSYGDVFLGILMGVASVYGLWFSAGLLIALLAG
jgi:hypothetical protein